MTVSFRIISGYEAGRSFTMVEGESRILGRQRPCDILIYDELVSRKHALLKIQFGKPILSDLGSSNGSYIASHPLKKQQPYKLHDYFVLGTTILKVVPTEPECNDETWSISAAELNALSRLPFFKEAHSASKSHPVMNMSHLLYGLLVTHEERLQPIFRKLGVVLSASKLKRKLETNDLFSGSYQWLNNCLKNLTLIEKPSFLLITPKVRDQIMAFNDHMSDWPEQMLYRIIKDFHNLAVISLDLPHDATQADTLAKLKEEGRPVTAKMTTIDPELKGKELKKEPLSWSDSFWKQFSSLCQSQKRLLLTGSIGSGKSNCVQAFVKKESGDYFDFRAFFFLKREPGELQGFINSIQSKLEGTRWVVIDHLDYIIDHGNDSADFIRDLNEATAPVMAVVSRKHLNRIHKLCPSFLHQDFDTLIKPELKLCYSYLIRTFQKKAKMNLTNKAYRILEEKVIARDPYNLGFLQRVLSLALDKLNQVNLSMRGKKGERELDEACFEQVLEQSFLKPQSFDRDSLKKHREELGIAGLAHGTGGLRERVILTNVEKLIQEYARNLWKVEMEYSDGSKQLDDQIHLTRDQKLEELGRQLGIIFTLQQESFQKWYEQFIYDMEPNNIEQDVGSVRQHKQLWQTYRKRMEKMTPDLVQDKYNRLCGTLLEKALYQPTTQLPPVDDDV